MAYNDKNYASKYPPQQPYTDNDNYYSYDNSQPHRTYDQAGYNASEPGLAAYKDEPSYGAGTKETVIPASGDDFSSTTRALEPRCAHRGF
jgi:hypothetical protein